MIRASDATGRGPESDQKKKAHFERDTGFEPAAPQLGKPKTGQEVTHTYALVAAGAGIDRHGAAQRTSRGSRNVTRRHQIESMADSQHAELATTAPYLGGTPRWFVCPVAGARCRIVYLVQGRWISRRAFRGAYPVQHIKTAKRRTQQAARRTRAVAIAAQAHPRICLPGLPYSALPPKTRLSIRPAGKKVQKSTLSPRHDGA